MGTYVDNFTGKTAVITGAASGIGLELAHRFGAAGMNLVIADIEEPALAAASSALGAAGCDVASMVVDVRDLEQLRALESLARDRFADVHLLCNNAGVGGGGPIADLDNLDMWRWVIDVDLWGVIYGCKVFLPAMIKHGEPCHVVNTASMAGHGSVAGMGAYCVSKYGVVALSETLAMEMTMNQTNVGVSVLCPAFVKTGIANSDRNLPDDLKAKVPAPGEGGMRDILDALVAGGISTEAVAEAVHDAVANDRFWILTHDESRAHILGRANGIVNGTHPGATLPGNRG